MHIVQTSSSTDPTHSEWEGKDVTPNDNQALVINSFTEEDQDLYEDLVFLANDDLPETKESSPDSTEYFARVLQSSDSTTDLSEKKSLLKKINELLVLLDDAINPDGITTATQHIVTSIRSLKAMMSPQANKLSYYQKICFFL